MDHPLIEYLGEISDAEKGHFLGDAAAVLCTYDWPEPFGIVLIEALACGNPGVRLPPRLYSRNHRRRCDRIHLRQLGRNGGEDRPPTAH